jgi:class 3 adenylate cyclase
MVEADARGALMRLAGDRVVRPSARYTLDEVADQLAGDILLVRRVWRSLGLLDAGPGAVVASDDDVELVSVCLQFLGVLGEEHAFALYRTYGASMARVTEASSSAFIAAVQDLGLATSHSEARTAKAYAEAMSIVPRIGWMLDVVLRHQVESARVHFERAAGDDGDPSAGYRVGVAFVDLSGFTAVSQALTLAELELVLTGFEDRATELAGERGARVVKFVGDAAMVVHSNTEAVAHVALALTSQGIETPTGEVLAARGGLSTGIVLAKDGDYFGTPVNLAARLVASCEPGQLIASRAAADLLPADRWSLSELPPVALRGFSEAVPRFLVTAGP